MIRSSKPFPTRLHTPNSNHHSELQLQTIEIFTTCEMHSPNAPGPKSSGDLRSRILGKKGSEVSVWLAGLRAGRRVRAARVNKNFIPPQSLPKESNIRQQSVAPRISAPMPHAFHLKHPLLGGQGPGSASRANSKRVGGSPHCRAGGVSEKKAGEVGPRIKDQRNQGRDRPVYGFNIFWLKHVETIGTTSYRW